MKLKIYQVDAFTDKIFSGNPAAVCPLESWLSDALLQQIAAENNLAETAFYLKQGNEYQIRWFTPTVEVDLCGHATLATAFVLFFYENHIGDTIHFSSSRSGTLNVSKQGDYLTLNFPTDVLEPVSDLAVFKNCFTILPQEVFKGKTDYLLIYENEEQIKKAIPSFSHIAQLSARGVIISAAGNEVDFVSRFFAPQCGINEDPVTGSAHTSLTPYWTKKLGKTELTALQLSERKGQLKCRFLNERVEISGQARLYLSGEIYTS